MSRFGDGRVVALLDSLLLFLQVWPGNTAFPDFFHPNATSYWTTQAQAYHDQVKFDGIWIVS